MAQNNNLNLNLILWNANGLRNKLGELFSFLNSYKVDIMVITETKLAQNIKIKVRNYNLHRNDRNNRGGGVAILIKNKIAHARQPTINTSIENVSIRLTNDVLIVGAYARPNLLLDNDDLDAIFNLNQKILVLGDFNARHRY